MLAIIEAMLLRAVNIAIEFDKDNGKTVTIGQISRTKAQAS